LQTRGEAFRGNGQFAEAIHDALRVLEIEPDNTFARNTLNYSRMSKK
jgi:hypothetical protein